MAVKGHIWRCPLCKNGVRGGTRPRKNNIVRYCLDCSKKEGFLVERVCEVLEAKRAVAKEKSVAKSAAKKEKAKLDGMVAGIDIMAECRKVWKLPALREHHRGTSMPEVEFRRRRVGNHSSGHAWGSWRITMTLPEDEGEVYGVILHELTHAALAHKRDARGERIHHGPLFWSVLRTATRERWPGAKIVMDATNGWTRQNQIDQAIREVLSRQGA